MIILDANLAFVFLEFRRPISMSERFWIFAFTALASITVVSEGVHQAVCALGEPRQECREDLFKQPDMPEMPITPTLHRQLQIAAISTTAKSSTTATSSALS